MFDQEKIALTACQSLYIDTEFNILYVQAVSQGATNAHARHLIRHYARHHARQIEDKHPSAPRW